VARVAGCISNPYVSYPRTVTHLSTNRARRRVTFFIRQRQYGEPLRRGRSKPGCRIIGSVTILWLTTEADDVRTYAHLLHYLFLFYIKIIYFLLFFNVLLPSFSLFNDNFNNVSIISRHNRCKRINTYTYTYN